MYSVKLGVINFSKGVPVIIEDCISIDFCRIRLICSHFGHVWADLNSLLKLGYNLVY